MREFAHSVGAFTTWKGEENKRANFLRNAVDIIRACALQGFACLVEHEPYARTNAQYHLSEWVGTPYALAGRDCVAHANIWLRKDARGLDVDYIFKPGDADAGELRRVLVKDNQPAPIFAQGKSSVPGTVGVTPLQAADFAAYEVLKAHRLGENLPLYRCRRSILELAKVLAWWGSYTESDLKALCERVQVPPRHMVQANADAVQA